MLEMSEQNNASYYYFYLIAEMVLRGEMMTSTQRALKISLWMLVPANFWSTCLFLTLACRALPLCLQ